ncbi:GTPase IMAP family member 2-like [Archocentrus centrarchus]|uniref:GTPase IMAP family member 2-like n=1 Tax=Archocentrus centrarchus TaxID=63155 RepID=UPI0011EA1C37|nr:GTPase IMAP family member 2-like [Archocentrus centrarchus]
MSSAERSYLPGELKPVFNIILLGNSGTGKSASGNTLLKAGKHRRNPGQLFASYPSSTAVTTTCEQIVVKMFGRLVGVVDTPDFFNEDKPADEAQIQECKKYCKPRQFVILLVIQLGRFTDGERGILQKLENEFGSIRDNTIILFTHGEDLHCNVEEFIGDRSHLRDIVEACGNRYHVFSNNSNDSKQVKALFERFEPMFPNFRTKESFPLFCCG